MAILERQADRRAGRFRRRRVAADDEAVGGRGAGAGAAAAAAAGAGTLLVARLIRALVGLIVLIIVLGIAFVVLDANGSNTIVSHVHDAAKTLAGPFDGIFTLSSSKATIALNWGLAAVIYAIIGGLIASFVARIGLAARGEP